MRVRHTETRFYDSDPSVKFYRTIAFSFLFVTIVILAVVVFMTSKKVTITIFAKEDTKAVDLTVKVAKEKADGVLSGVVDTANFSFTQKYYPSGYKTVEGVAIGEAVVYNKTAAAQTLVKTTRLLTSNGVLFRLTNQITVPANGQIIAAVYADKAGKDSEIGPSQFTIPGLSVDKQKFIYAESKGNMAGGVKKVGIITDSDLQAAKKDYEEKVKQAYLDKLGALEGDNRVAVQAVNINSSADKKVGDEVSEFTFTGSSTLAVVQYNEKDLNALVEKALVGKVGVGAEKITSSAAEAKVAVAVYDKTAGTAELTVTQTVSATLDANGDKLSAQYFMGKNKDEIERYVLGLDHVSGVEVKFRPVWISKAPSVPDNIKVVVKNVK